MSKRIKYVFQDNDAIAHLWVGHNLSGEGQDNARNPRNNFYFSGDTIYSYGSHFPIAKFVRNGKKKAIQFTTRGYSPTTSGHIGVVRQAVRGNKIPVFYLQNPDGDKGCTTEGIADYLSRITIAIQSQIKARSTRNVLDYRGSALSSEAECQAYCRFWKVKAPKFPALPALPKDFKARRAREADLKAARDERDRVANEARAKQYAIDNAERIAKDTAAINEWNENKEQHIADWLAGGSLDYLLQNQGYGYRYDHLSSIPKIDKVPTLLRIVGAEVETSQHASFPIAHAKRGLALVRSVMSRGTEWKSNGHTCKLGLYQIERITADGTVYAGCHIVPWESIARIADQVEAYQGNGSESEA